MTQSPASSWSSCCVVNDVRQRLSLRLRPAAVPREAMSRDLSDRCESSNIVLRAENIPSNQFRQNINVFSGFMLCKRRFSVILISTA